MASYFNAVLLEMSTILIGSAALKKKKKRYNNPLIQSTNPRAFKNILNSVLEYYYITNISEGDKALLAVSASCHL